MSDSLVMPPAGSRSRLLTAAAAAVLLVALLLALLRVTSLDRVGGVRLSAAEWVMSDFKSVVYYPAKAFAAGDNPYDAKQYLARHPAPEGFRMYPPIMLVLAQPFAMLPLKWAVGLNVAVTLVLSGILALVSLRLGGARGRLPAVLFVTALILLSRPGQWNLLQGQVTLPLVLAAYAAVVLDRSRAVLSGCALALCLVKPNFGLPLAVVMLARGQVRPVALGTGLIVLANLPLVGVLAERAGGLARFVGHVAGAQDNLKQTADLLSQMSVFRVDGVALLTRFAGTGLGAIAPILVGGLVLGLVVVALRINRGQAGEPGVGSERGSPSPAVAGLIWSGILLCGYHIGYDLLLLAWPFTALVLQVVRAGRQTPMRHWVALALLALLAGNYVTSFAIIEALRDALRLPPALSLTLASLNSMALLGLFLLYLYEVLKPALALAPSAGVGSEGFAGSRQVSTLRS
jgi:hypothetical protein